MLHRTLSDSCFSHVINAPIERVDIPDWLLHLPNAEYRRCCPEAHIAAGASTTDDGRPMSINVEMIGDSLLVQQYVAEVTDSDHCRMVSISDVFSPLGRTTSHVVWDLSVEPLDDQSCEYINHLTATATRRVPRLRRRARDPLRPGRRRARGGVRRAQRAGDAAVRREHRASSACLA